MREYKTLAEWLESQGNPKHSIAEGENGSKVIVVDDSSFLGNSIAIYSFRESDVNGYKSFCITSGWGLRKEYLSALKQFLNDETIEEKSAGKLTLDEALAKRNEAKARRRNFKKNDETPVGILTAEYDWGFWDAVVTIMKNCGMKKLDAKAVQ
jgi:hypothetical protein